MRWIGSLILVGLVGIGACAQRPTTCQICSVPIPDATRTVVRLAGQGDVQVCDPRCALTHQDQTGAAVALVTVTDFDTGRPLDPAAAFYVTGSHVAPDAHAEMIRGMAGEVAELHWHRCVPSVLAFGSEEAALQFQRQQGGSMMRISELGFHGTIE